MGPSAAAINGIYDPISNHKSQDDRVRYRKRDDAQMWIEHHEGTWDIKNSTNLGSQACKAYISGGCRLELCKARDWKVTEGGGWKEQTTVNLTFGAEAERLVGARHSVLLASIILTAKHFHYYNCRLLKLPRQPLPKRSAMLLQRLLPRENATKLKPHVYHVLRFKRVLFVIHLML